MRPDVMYSLPSEDAPLSEWLRPLSATMRNERESLSFSTVDKSKAHDGGGANRILNRIKTRRRNQKILDMRAEGASFQDIAQAVGLDSGYVKTLHGKLKKVIKNKPDP